MNMKLSNKSLVSTFALIGMILLTVTYLFGISPAQGQTNEPVSSVGEPPADDPIFDGGVVKHEHPQVELAGAAASLVTTKETIPNFAAFPTVISKKSGNWSSPATWAEGRVPGVNDVVKIAFGHTVTYDTSNSAALAALGVEGVLTFSTNKNTILKVGTILIYRNGSFLVGTQSSPIASNVTTEIIIANRPLATSGPDAQTKAYDPKQFGTGIISFGEVVMHGKKIAKTWFRLTKEPKAGQQKLSLESVPSGWSVGDKIVLPDTRQTPLIRVYSKKPNPPIALQLEELIISGISGRTITLTAPLKYDHLGGRDTDGNLIALPHVGNLTRNITIRSESPDGVRGHTMLTERSRIDIRYASFQSMGRTTSEPLDNTVITNNVVIRTGINQIGRYPIHFHHMMGPRNTSNKGYQFAVIGNSVVDGAKWGIAVHNSHFGLISNNVVYDVEGSGIVTEAGNERENRFENNFVVKMGTPKQGLYKPVYGGVAGPGRTLKFGDFGWEGTALWFNGNDNYVTGNVAADAAFAGIMYNSRPAGFSVNQPLVPKFRGAEIGNKSEWKQYRREDPPMIRESSNNEAYASAVGTWVSFSAEVGTLSDFLLWNIKQTGVYSARNLSVAYDNFTIISDQSVSNANNIQRTNIGLDFRGSTYTSGAISFTNSRVEGFNVGVGFATFKDNSAGYGDIPPITVLDNVILKNYVNAIEVSSRHVNKYTLLRDVTFVQNDGPINQFLSLTPAAMLTKMESSWTHRGVVIPSQTYVFNHNKKRGNDFEVFFKEQAPNYVMALRDKPAGSGNKILNANCPTPGLTNQQCWDKHKVAYMGGVAPCDDAATNPEIDGFTCPVRASESYASILSKFPETPTPTENTSKSNQPVVVPPSTPTSPPPTPAPTLTPTLELTSSKDTVTAGDSVTLNWISANTNSCQASSNWSGAKSTSNTETVGPLSVTQTFTITCTGTEGSVVKNVTVTVIENNTDNTDETDNDFAITSQSVTSIVAEKAVVNVVLNEVGTLVVNYGNNINNLNKTVSGTTNSLTHNLTLVNLNGNATFYQVVATDESGKIISSVTNTFDNLKSNSGNKSQNVAIEPVSFKTGDAIKKSSRGGGSGNEESARSSGYGNSNTDTKQGFLRTLYKGIKGEDVRNLQRILNSDPATRITAFGEGSSGFETTYFGGLTSEAVGKFQIKHGILKNRSEEGYGQVGPITLAKINSLQELDDAVYVPVTVTDEGKSSILQQIQELLITVQALQQQLKQKGIQTNTESQDPVTYEYFNRNLAYGSEGEDVRQLQKLLNSDPDTRITGFEEGALGLESTFFGKKTEDAVKRFQRKYNIVHSGTPAGTGYGAFGPATRQVMSSR
jgi:peptidoglycan hydrolase-like protein with peptidoglycan-binding domain